MSACEFNVPLSGSADEMIEKARAAVESQGGFFQGDANQGTFNVSFLSNTVAGSYRITDNILALRIDEKPMFLPCQAIESLLIKKLT